MRDPSICRGPDGLFHMVWTTSWNDRIIGATWFVYYDCYRKGRYGGVTSTDLEEWTDVTARLEFPPGARHGTALRVDRPVLDRLEALSK